MNNRTLPFALAGFLAVPCGACGSESSPAADSGDTEPEEDDDGDEDDDGEATTSGPSDDDRPDADDDAEPDPDTDGESVTDTAGTGDETGAAETDGGETSGDDSPSQPPILPTWILRDADGNVVPALVSPSCGTDPSEAGPCPPGEPAGEYPYNCVFISAYESQYWSVSYRLSNGSATGCYAPQSLSDVALYPRSDDPDAPPSCGVGQAYHWSPGIESAKLLDGRLMYASAELEPVDDSNGFWRGTPANCEGLGGVNSLPWYYPLIDVPTAVTDVLDNPPYSVALEY